MDGGLSFYNTKEVINVQTIFFEEDDKGCYRRECGGCIGCYCDEDNPPQGEENC